MKKLVLPFLFSLLFLPALFSCSSSRLANYTLNEKDAAAAIREMLSLGADGSYTGAFSKDRVMQTVFPESLRKALNTLNQLGLTNEVDRFTTTMALAAEKTAQRSVPVFASSISKITFSDAMRLIRNGGTSATDYLRTSSGTELRQAVTPVMREALSEYKLNEQWDEIMKPIRAFTKEKVNLQLDNLMAGLVTEAMFQKIAEKEKEVRENENARTTPLLRKVFRAAARG